MSCGWGGQTFATPISYLLLGGGLFFGRFRRFADYVPKNSDQSRWPYRLFMAIRRFTAVVLPGRRALRFNPRVLCHRHVNRRLPSGFASNGRVSRQSGLRLRGVPSRGERRFTRQDMVAGRLEGARGDYLRDDHAKDGRNGVHLLRRAVDPIGGRHRFHSFCGFNVMFQEGTQDDYRRGLVAKGD